MTSISVLHTTSVSRIAKMFRIRQLLSVFVVLNFFHTSSLLGTDLQIKPCGHNVFTIEHINVEENEWTGVLDVAGYNLLEMSIDVKLDDTAKEVFIEKSRGVGRSSPGKMFHADYYRPVGGFVRETFIVRGEEGQLLPNILSLSVNGQEICPNPVKLNNIRIVNRTTSDLSLSASSSSYVWGTHHPLSYNANNHHQNRASENNNEYATSTQETSITSREDSVNQTTTTSSNSIGTEESDIEIEKEPFSESGSTTLPQIENEGDPEVGPNISFPSNCGRRMVQHQGLVMSGLPSKEGDWPWHAAIYHVGLLYSTIYKCGGTLITASIVLTAAHCVTENGRPLIPSRVIVKLGMHDRLISSKHSREFRVFKIIPHEKFDESDLKNDISIVHLGSEIELSNYIQPACLWPLEDDEQSSVVDEVGTVVGWGLTEEGGLADLLTQGHMPVVSMATCLESNRDFFGLFLSENNFCAGYRNGTSVCNGDSGGGMFFKRNETYFIRGIVSLSVSMDNEDVCNPKEFILFTDVAKYISWIKNNL